MKKFISIIFFASVSLTTYADNCLKLSQNQNWPDDQFQIVLNCSLESNNVGNAYGDKICFSISKTQSSGYKTTFYKTLRYNTNRDGSLVTIIAMNENGDICREGQISTKGNVTTFSYEQYSFEFNQKWIESTKVNFQDLSSIKFEVHKKTLFSKNLTESSTYSCFREI